MVSLKRFILTCFVVGLTAILVACPPTGPQIKDLPSGDHSIISGKVFGKDNEANYKIEVTSGFLDYWFQTDPDVTIIGTGTLNVDGTFKIDLDSKPQTISFTDFINGFGDSSCVNGYDGQSGLRPGSFFNNLVSSNPDAQIALASDYRLTAFGESFPEARIRLNTSARALVDKIRQKTISRIYVDQALTIQGTLECLTVRRGGDWKLEVDLQLNEGWNIVGLYGTALYQGRLTNGTEDGMNWYFYPFGEPE